MAYIEHEITGRPGEEIFVSSYLGKVEDIDDPQYEGRCRIRVFSLFDDMNVVDLPWAVPVGKPMFFGQDARAGSISIPKVGAIVRVKFLSGDIYSPEYSQIQEIGEDIKEQLRKGGTKYEGAHFILFDGDEEIKFWFDKQIGLQMELKKSFIRIDNETSNILIEHKDDLSTIALEGNVIRIVSDSEVKITTGSQATISAKTVFIDGQNTVVGPSKIQHSAVLGEPLFAILKVMAAAIDAKMPSTAGAIQAAVEASKPMVLSGSVTISAF
jgi:hypothetical protein